MKEYLKKNGIRLGIILLVVVAVAAVGAQALSGSAGFLTNAVMAVRDRRERPFGGHIRLRL